MPRSRTIHRAATMMLAFGGIACSTVSPSAEVVRSSQSAAARQFEVTPCAWAAGVDGDVSFGGLSASLPEELGDSDWTGMLTVVVPLDRWTLFGDAARLDRSGTRFAPNGSSELSVDMEQRIYGLSVGRRVTEGGNLDVDVLVGLRYTSIDAEVFAAGPQTHRFDNGGDAWIDAIVGTRLAYHFAEQLAVVGMFDVGAKTAQGIASVDFDVSHNFTAKFGYRYLYTDGDITGSTSGFFVGLGIRF